MKTSRNPAGFTARVRFYAGATQVAAADSMDDLDAIGEDLAIERQQTVRAYSKRGTLLKTFRPESLGC